jgi:hypothetical protein
MSRFTGFGGRLTVPVVLAGSLVLGTTGATLALLSGSASASTPNFIGGGGTASVPAAGSVNFETGITGSGLNVNGQFTEFEQGGARFTVRATCLVVNAQPGGTSAFVGGRITASTVPGLVGSGFVISAGDNRISGLPDTLSVGLVEATVPSPTDCLSLSESVSLAFGAVTHGNIVIRQGR